MLKLLGLGSLGALVASYPIFIERFMLELNHYRIPIPNLPPAFDGFRIVQLSDMHIGPMSPEWFLQSAVDMANKIPKDIIVFTGDAVQSDVPDSDIDTIWKMLGSLQAPSGVYSIYGNHDHWIGIDKSMHYAEKYNRVLRHQAVRLERDGQHVWLGGFGDLWDDDLGADACFANSEKNDCRIVLAHNPDTADIPLDYDIDLYICGHTHGGQANLPIIRDLVTPVNNLNYIQGLVQSENSQVFISKGIGWGGCPARINCPPEVALIELKCG